MSRAATSSFERASRTCRVLAIDGGGVRGVIPAYFIRRIEELASKPAWQLFDVICGTSTGAFITALLTQPTPLSGRELVEYYSGAEPAKFFTRSLLYRIVSGDGLLRPKYPESSHSEPIRRALGETAELKDAKTEILIPIYDLRSKPPRAVYLTRHGALESPSRNYKLWEVVKAASTATGYFPGWAFRSVDGRSLHYPVDAGIFLNNPALQGLTHATELYGGRSEKGAIPEHFAVLSLGTGAFDHPIVGAEAERWGFLRWAPNLIDMIFEAQSEATNHQVGSMLDVTSGDHHYVRLQARLPEAFLLDDTSKVDLGKMEAAAEREMKSKAGDIDRLVEELLG